LTEETEETEELEKAEETDITDSKSNIETDLEKLGQKKRKR
jgi:hypothetical protein